jgi:hypothetical protein
MVGDFSDSARPAVIQQQEPGTAPDSESDRLGLSRPHIFG